MSDHPDARWRTFHWVLLTAALVALSLGGMSSYFLLTHDPFRAKYEWIGSRPSVKDAIRVLGPPDKELSPEALGDTVYRWEDKSGRKITVTWDVRGDFESATFHNAPAPK